MIDTRLQDSINRESNRQDENIELIASENFVSKAVLDVTGSILTNKYAEGYPNNRYYGGCEYVDEVEDLAREYVCKLFNAEHANVQPHSGSQANMAVIMSVLQPGERILGMDLNAGGHLTHGYKMSFSGKLFESYSYGVDKDSETINYDEVLRIAKEVKPKLIIAGASAYPRVINFKKFREIADEVGAYLMVDMAHIAGLVAAGLHESPIPYADFVTSTTHKTLRGPRGGLILCKEEYAKLIDKTVFPGIQGGPLMHIIAGKAQCFYEALQPEFKDYANQIINNCKALGEALTEEGFRLVSGGTDNHLFTVVVTGLGLNGLEAETLLHKNNITLNKNAVPNDPLPPFKASGLRIGSPAMTTRGFKEEEFRMTARYIDKIFKNKDNEEVLKQIREEIKTLLKNFPLPY